MQVKFHHEEKKKFLESQFRLIEIYLFLFTIRIVRR